MTKLKLVMSLVALTVGIIMIAGASSAGLGLIPIFQVALGTVCMLVSLSCITKATIQTIQKQHVLRRNQSNTCQTFDTPTEQ